MKELKPNRAFTTIEDFKEWLKKDKLSFIVVMTSRDNQECFGFQDMGSEEIYYKTKKNNRIRKTTFGEINKTFRFFK